MPGLFFRIYTEDLVFFWTSPHKLHGLDGNNIPVHKHNKQLTVISMFPTHHINNNIPPFYYAFADWCTEECVLYLIAHLWGWRGNLRGMVSVIQAGGPAIPLRHNLGSAVQVSSEHINTHTHTHTHTSHARTHHTHTHHTRHTHTHIYSKFRVT